MTAVIPSVDLAGLDLAQLRRHRRHLASEEDRVSYWRRLTHARIDLLRAESGSQESLSFEELVRVLGDTGTGTSRGALVRVIVADPLPELPELSAIWCPDVDPHDRAQLAATLTSLEAAERQLTTYRTALHDRIDESTRELILRYRSDPSAALSIIPRD